MFQLSGRSGSRPFSWPSPRLSLPASLRGWQRSAHRHEPEWHVFIPALLYERLCLALVGRSHFCRGWSQTQALWCHCARRRIMTLEPASTHYRFAKSSVKNHLSYHHSKWPKSCAQFLYGRGLKQVDVRTIQGVSVGQKDQNKGLFHLWQEIFQLPRTKRYKMPKNQKNKSLFEKMLLCYGEIHATLKTSVMYRVTCSTRKSNLWLRNKLIIYSV